ncbi:MAG: methyltransferase domain-containing protein [Streptosporangiales bacterium]|nr:methyltransferase domain-containing protein [Streptosporangiales bacterium]
MHGERTSLGSSAPRGRVRDVTDQRDARVRPNAGQASGPHRARLAALFDAEIAPHNALFRAAAGVRPHDRVLDVGCGTGESTREAARAAIGGSALGVDLSVPLLDHARRLTEEEGLRNVAYEQADVQVHRFPPGAFDLCISRFGVMFFADPVAAFTNIARALRPGARLVVLVWQERDRNEWSTAVRETLLGGAAAPAPPAGGQHPFSLGDPAVAERVLTAAGFTDVGFTDVHEPVYYGTDEAEAYDFVRGLQDVRDLLDGIDAGAAERARGRLRATLAAHATASGVFFDSRAWIVDAVLPTGEAPGPR